LGKGEALEALRMHMDAIQYLDKALVIEPNNSYALLIKGITLNETGNPKEAIENLGKVLEIDPNNYFAYKLKLKLENRTE